MRPPTTTQWEATPLGGDSASPPRRPTPHSHHPDPAPRSVPCNNLRCHENAHLVEKADKTYICECDTDFIYREDTDRCEQPGRQGVPGGHPTSA